MKKIHIAAISGFMAVMLGVPQALAASANSEKSMTFYINDAPQTIQPITITSASSNDITVANGITITIPDSLNTIWEKNVKQLQLTGTAVTKGEIAASVDITYPDPALNVVHIPVLKNFSAGDYVVISGLVMRIYDWTNSYSSLEYRFSGNDYPDYTDISGIQISDATSHTDTLAPYDVADFKVVQTTPTTVKLSWTNPADIDLGKIEIGKSFTRNGVINSLSTDYGANSKTAAQPQELTDNVQVGDQVTYTVFVHDYNNNRSNGITKTLTIVANPQTSSTQQVTNTQQSTQQTTTGTQQQVSTTQQTSSSTQQQIGAAIQDITVTTRVDKTISWGTWLRIWYVDSILKHIAPNTKYRIDYQPVGSGKMYSIFQEFGPTGRTNARATFKCDPQGYYSVNVYDVLKNKLVWSGTRYCLK